MFADWGSYVIAALAAANLGLIGWLVWRTAAGTGGAAIAITGRFDAIERNDEVLRRALGDMDQGLRREIAAGARDGLAAAFDKVQAGTKAQADGLVHVQHAMNQLADTVRGGFDGFAQRLREEQELLRGRVDARLDELRSGNEQKLEQMRLTVDEQLQSALGKRLQESFQQVTEQFAQVQQAIGQVQSVAGQIGDLKRLFSNVKMRGGIGEGHLRALLDDFLPPGAYEANLHIAETGEIVEYAVRIPVKGASAAKWLAIDSKFPTEDYERLVQASEANDRDQEIVARKALERKIREEAKKISNKYIKPPQTLEYAIMYLPSEGLDSEVSRMPGLIDTLRRQYAIHVMGPRVLPAHLHIIRVGYLTLALEEKAGVIGETLSAVKAEWGKLGKSLDVLASRANTLVNGIKETQRRTRVVGTTLETIDAVEFERAEEVLGLSDGATLIDAEADDDEIPVLVPNRRTANDDPASRDAAE